MAKRKRKKSLIKRPGAKKIDKDAAIESVMHAFRTTERDPITQILNSMGNKSEFIMEAVRQYAQQKHSIFCPRCKGTGRIIRDQPKRK